MVKDRPILERRFIAKGTVIIKDGDEGDFAYIVQSGSVEIYKRQGNRDMTLTTLKPGAFFGEMSLLFGEKRSAYARAKEDCNLILITRGTLEDKLENSDQTIRAIVKALIDRISKTNDMLASKDDEIGNLAQALYTIFARALDVMPQDQRKDFRKAAAPVLEQFIDIINEFNITEDEE